MSLSSSQQEHLIRLLVHIEQGEADPSQHGVGLRAKLQIGDAVIGDMNGRAVPACLRQGHALRQLLDIQLRQIVLAALRHLAGKLIGVEILEGKALAHGEITVEIVHVAVIGIVAAQAGGLRR